MFMFYHNLTIYRKPGSDSPPYYENPLVMHAINDSILPNPIGPLGNISRETKSGGKDPLEGPSKRAACALLNHYYRIDRNFLVSSEQERSNLVLGLSKKGRETGINKPDLLVEIYNKVEDKFSDLIFCEVKRSEKKEEYTEVLDQIAQASSQSITRLNENVYVCVIYGTKISFFSKYDVEQPEPHYRDLVPYYPKRMDKDSLERDMGAVVHVDAQNDIYACEFDLRNKESYAYTHACFIEMSTPAGPIDPEE